MEETKVISNSKCLHPAYTKEEIDEKLDKKLDTSSILSGTAEPSNSIGENGDIYLKY